MEELQLLTCEMYAQLEFLDTLASRAKPLSGGPMVDLVEKLTRSGDPRVAAQALALFQDVFYPLYNMLLKWLLYG